jgi:hypothetical protein
MVTMSAILNIPVLRPCGQKFAAAIGVHEGSVKALGEAAGIA